MTRDQELVRFLQWALPRMGMRWRGFRNVRRQVGRRVRRRIGLLGLPDLAAYRVFLESDVNEWEVLDQACRVSISRFFRDRRLFETLGRQVLPALQQQRRPVRVWSAGCASGEEPYSVVLAGMLGAENPVELEVIATDAEEKMLQRARQATYSASTLRELPPQWIERAFVQRSGEYELRQRFRKAVQLEQQDLRTETPDGAPFGLVLCRNLLLTYHDDEVQRRVLRTIHARLEPDGLLAVGSHEHLPSRFEDFERWGPEGLPLHRRCGRL